MSVGLAKLGASLGLAAGLACLPLVQYVHVERPSVLYAAVYLQAVLGNTDSAVKIAEQAAESEAAQMRRTATQECSQLHTF